MRDLRDYGDTSALTAVAIAPASERVRRERRLRARAIDAHELVVARRHSRRGCVRAASSARSTTCCAIRTSDRSCRCPASSGRQRARARDSLAARVVAHAAAPHDRGADVERGRVDRHRARVRRSTRATRRMLARVGRLFSPIDVSYTRSLLTALDATRGRRAAGVPIRPRRADRRSASINGMTATTAGQTGCSRASEALRASRSARRSSIASAAPRRTNWIAANRQVAGAGGRLAAAVSRRGAPVGVSARAGASVLVQRSTQQRRLRRAATRPSRCRVSIDDVAGGDPPHAHRDVPDRGFHRLGGPRRAQHRREVSAHAPHRQPAGERRAVARQ